MTYTCNRCTLPVNHSFARQKIALSALTFLLFLGVFNEVVLSQTMMPMAAYGRTYTSSQIRGYWFTAPTDFIITGLRVPTDVGTAPQYIEIVKLATAPPVFSASTTNYTVLGLFTNVNSTAVISTWIEITAGDVIAIFGTRSSNGTSHANSYGTPETWYSSNILGYPVTLTRMVYQGNSYPVAAISQEVNAAIARTEMYYIPPITGPNDAGISSIDSPVNFCAGTVPVTVTLKNYGTNPLTSATINWSLNGVPQTPVPWTGFLDTLSPATRATQVTLSTQNFAAGVPYTITAWSTLPNGVQDTVSRNDSAQITTQAAISGTFTIGGAAPDYATFSDAVDDLNKFGVCGPVVYKVRSGTYNEQISLGAIDGASPSNYITFESETGNPADVELTYGANSTNNYTVQFNGGDHITFQNMTITATNASYGRVVDFATGSSYCMLNNLILNGVNTTSSTYNRAVIYSGSGTTNHYCTIQNCVMNRGSYGAYWYGSGSTSLENGTIFENNTINNFYYAGLYLYYQNSPLVTKNTTTTTSTYTNYGISLSYCDNNLRATKNSVTFLGTGTKYGIRVYYSDASNGNEGLIANNFVTSRNGSNTFYGLYPYYANYQEFFNNTVYTNNTSTSYRCVYAYYGGNLKFKNNILYHDGRGYAFYTNRTTNVVESDYNLFYSNGARIAYWGGNRVDLSALRAANGMDANSVSKTVSFVDESIGDLHLTGSSEDDPDLIGIMLTEVSDDIDSEARMLPYIGADEACYITKGSVWYELTDANGIQSPYANVPGTMGVHYHVEFPEFDATITVTLRFYNISNNVLTYTTSFTATKAYATTLDGVQVLTLSTIPKGVYRVVATFNTKNSCGGYRDYIPSEESFMILDQGETPCIVWPGDVNNDGLVNYGDRTSLNTYIHDANLSSTWLTGPARYRADEMENPLTYLEWEAQAAVPWATPEGCYMDADGNGIVNSFDYIPMKTNWMRDHGIAGPKAGNSFNPETFDMSQNFPNPFNPTTDLQYSVPERSKVMITVVDVLGKEVATLANAEMEAGVYNVTFDGSQIGSGIYIAVANMQGLESGTTFTKPVRMTLSK